MDHPLLLIGCYMNPLFQGMEFISGERLRMGYHSKAEELKRKLIRKHKIHLLNTKSLNDWVDVEEKGPLDEDEDGTVTARNHENSCQLQIVQKGAGKKRVFDLMNFADSKLSNFKSLGELFLSNLLVVDHLVEDRQKFLNDDNAVILFWRERRNHIPNIFSKAIRIYAIPLSSAASEHVFSALPLLMNDKLSTLSTSLINPIVVIRSVRNC